MKIKGYIKEFGNKSFDEFPLGEVDSIIFSIISYYKWERYCPKLKEDKPSIPLSSFTKKETVLDLLSTAPTSGDSYALWISIITSKRFKDVKINYFSSAFDKSIPEQFAAMTFILPNGTFLVAYRGTDLTYVGWKEDFNMAIYDVLPSHYKASSYIEEMTKKLPGRFYISGHSKGGNLALYACTHMSLENKNRLIMARSHDGPGFRDVDSHIDALIPILKKVKSTVPESSLIGTLLGFRRNSKIVRCRAFFIFQHDPYKWDIDPKTGDFVYLTYRKQTSIASEMAMTKWLRSLSQEERERFIEVIFMVLDPDGDGEINFFRKVLGQSIIIIKRYKKLSPQDKEFVRTCFKRLRKVARGVIFKERLTYRKTTIFDESLK